METNYQDQVSQLDWLLDDLVLRVAHIQQAVFLSQDGLALGASRGLDQADAEHLAALAAGFLSLARGAGRHFGGGDVRQTIIEMTSGFLFVTAAGQGTCLAVLTGAETDVGLVAYEMAVLVRRTGDHLKVNMRTRSALSDGQEENAYAVQRRPVARCRSRTRSPAICADPGQDKALR
jgi:predicted regulator of Ras-like GTPase activity (Roadblock/LC7/MglB family)